MVFPDAGTPAMAIKRRRAVSGMLESVTQPEVFADGPWHSRAELVDDELGMFDVVVVHADESLDRIIIDSARALAVK